MLIALVIAAAALSQAGLVSVHLVVSDDPALRPVHRPSPRFTECSDCREVRVSLGGKEMLVRTALEPVLEIPIADISGASIDVTTTIYEPEMLLFTVRISLRDTSKLNDMVDRHWNERALIKHENRVSYMAWINPSWKRKIPIGLFETHAEARAFANRLNQDPVAHPFDRQSDERGRIMYLCSLLGDYSHLSQPRKEIEGKDPELIQFLDRYPRYWRLMSDESCP